MNVSAWQNPSVIAAEAIMFLGDNLVIGNLVTRDKTGEFTSGSMKVGDTINMRTNPDYTVTDFTNDGSNTITRQGINSTKRPFTIEKLFDVSIDITAKEKKLNIDSFSEQIIMPAAQRLAEKIDAYIGTKILTAAGLYASSGLFGTAADIALARQVATIQQLDPSSRICLVDTSTEASLLGQTWFNQALTRGTAGEQTLASGIMGRVMGMDFYSSVNFPTTSATVGTGVSTVNTTSGTTSKVGQSTLTMAASTGTFKVGDRISIAGAKRPMIVKTQAVATSTTLELVDPITEILTHGAAITVVSSGNILTYSGAIFDSRSIAMAMPPLDPPSDKPSYVVQNNGYSLRVVQGYDIDKKVEVMSIDCLVGAVAWDPRRITLLADY